MDRLAEFRDGLASRRDAQFIRSGPISPLMRMTPTERKNAARYLPYSVYVRAASGI